MGAWQSDPYSRKVPPVTQLRCLGCGASSGLQAAGWRGYRIVPTDPSDPPAVAFYCPACAAREFPVRPPLH